MTNELIKEARTANPRLVLFFLLAQIQSFLLCLTPSHHSSPWDPDVFHCLWRGRCDPAFPRHGCSTRRCKCRVSCEGTSWTDVHSGFIKAELLELTVKSWANWLSLVSLSMKITLGLGKNKHILASRTLWCGLVGLCFCWGGCTQLSASVSSEGLD